MAPRADTIRLAASVRGALARRGPDDKVLPMSFGRNPHVPKAQAAEQKAADASDTMARAAAYRDAAHQWDRAASREKPGKYRAEYEANAERNRALADAGADADPGAEADRAEPATSTRPTILN
jgi:hypothetical protein